MKFKNPYWTAKDKIQLLERWIITHSIIYYRLGTNIVSDFVFDSNSNQLVELIQQNHVAFRKTKYYKVFKGFDDSTGFELYSKLGQADREYLEQHAEYLVKHFGR